MAAEAQPIQWETIHGACVAIGNKDVCLISSVTQAGQAPLEVVPRCKIEMTEENRRKLTNQGIPPECSDDLSIIRARIDLDSTLELVRILVSEPGKELSRTYILEQIEEFLKSTKKQGGVIYYFGDGKRNTGDWRFSDGVITFGDIAAVYSKTFQGRILTIVTDCSYSGNWMKACSQYLDEQGVQPCGHSAYKKGILIKLLVSCGIGEVAATPCMSVQGIFNDKNTGRMKFYCDVKLRATQHLSGIDFTMIRCGKQFEDPCALSPEYTWHKQEEANRVFLVRGKDRGRSAWHYVLLVDDEETIKIFKEKTQGDAAGKESIDVANYGQIIKSGWGDDPPNEIKDWIQKNYTKVYY